jgi:hypothetical protein
MWRKQYGFELRELIHIILHIARRLFLRRPIVYHDKIEFKIMSPKNVAQMKRVSHQSVSPIVATCTPTAVPIIEVAFILDAYALKHLYSNGDNHSNNIIAFII